MSRKLRTLVVTLVARSFSSFDPAATFCLSRPAMVSLAALTAWVPAPVLSGAGAAAGAAGAGLVWASAAPTEPESTAAAVARWRIDRRTMGGGLLQLRTAAGGVEFPRRTIEAYHGDVPLEDRLGPAGAHLEPRDVGVGQVLGLGGP